MELNTDKVSNSTHEFFWKDVLKTLKVKVILPNLKDLKKTVWGDFGPMYSFDLDPKSPIQISYDGDEKTLDQKTLRIESPILVEDRNTHPYYVLVEDQEYGFQIYLYLNKGFYCDRVLVKRLSDQVILYKSQDSEKMYSRAM